MTETKPRQYKDAQCKTHRGDWETQAIEYGPQFNAIHGRYKARRMRDHLSWVWAKSDKWLHRRVMLTVSAAGEATDELWPATRIYIYIYVCMCLMRYVAGVVLAGYCIACATSQVLYATSNSSPSLDRVILAAFPSIGLEAGSRAVPNTLMDGCLGMVDFGAV